MSTFKVFCAEKESVGGKTYYQGFGGPFGAITVFTGERAADGKALLIVNIARPFRRRAGGFTRRGSSNRSGNNYSQNRTYGNRRSNYKRRY